MKYKIKNFTDANEIEISSLQFEGRPLICLVSDGGSLRFQHDLTPEQARGMAKFLIASAIEAETMVEEAIGCEVSHE